MMISPVRECEPVSSRHAYVPPGAAATMTLRAGTCRWPIGDVASEDFRFCLAPCGSASYCAAHQHVARRWR